METTLRTFSVLVDDEPGVLSQISRLFSRKGFNIESLAVGPTEERGLSRLTLEVLTDDQQTELLCNQLSKMVPVHSVRLLAEEHSIRREMVLCKVRAEERSVRSELIQLADRCGVILSSGIGGQAITESEHSRGLEKGFDRVSPFYVPTAICNMAAGQVAIDAGFRAMCSCPVTACAVGDAFHYIRDGYAEVMLCGGTEASITPMSIGGFTSMKALTQTEDPDRASIPFDAERSGFVMGEGAGVLLLEELEHAKARGAKIYAEVVGYGATCDAHHITAPLADGSGGAKAMAMALTDGGVSSEQVGYINAHGTSTHLNDAGETAAVKTVFGPHAYQLAMSSTKSMTGHMLGAAGAVEAIFTALSLRDGFLPATIHYQTPDPACDLDVVPNEGRPAVIRYALSNSLGFGGHNGSLLLKKWED